MSLHNIVRQLEDAIDDLPNLDKSELESRLSDLESEARVLLDGGIGGLEDRVADLVEGIQSLYNEV